MTHFGTTKAGQDVQALTISAGDLRVTLLTLGAILQDVRLSDVDHNLTLGSTNLADYEGPMHYHGALVGPLVNRLAGAETTIEGKSYTFDANQDGRHMLHSGRTGTQYAIWDVLDHGPAHVRFGVTLPDGLGGFPGNRRVEARFTVSAPATLQLEISGTTDQLTLMNFANHSYWNLDGTPNWAGHQMRVAADHMLPVGDGVIPTGEVRAVSGTGFDLRQWRTLTAGQPGIDHNFCLSDRLMPLRDVLWLRGTSDITMTYATNQPGVQIYDGGHSERPGGGLYEGFAIEAQGWPDAPNQAHFPSVSLAPDQTYAQVTQWRFSRG